MKLQCRGLSENLEYNLSEELTIGTQIRETLLENQKYLLQEFFWKWTILHPDGETSEPKGKKKCIKYCRWGNPKCRCLSNHAFCHFDLWYKSVSCGPTLRPESDSAIQRVFYLSAFSAGLKAVSREELSELMGTNQAAISA